MDDLISRQAVLDMAHAYGNGCEPEGFCVEVEDIQSLPSAEPEIIRCKECIYGYLYIDVQNGVTDSWIECRNPEGLNRDVSVDGYCSASIRRM